MNPPDKIEGFLEIGTNHAGEVVINLDKDRTAHINFSPGQARNLAVLLWTKADEINGGPWDWRVEPQRGDSKTPLGVATLIMGAMSMPGMDEATARQIVSNHYASILKTVATCPSFSDRIMRVEQCVRCQCFVSDWVDTDESKGRICRPCEQLQTTNHALGQMSDSQDKARAEHAHILDLYTQTAAALGMSEDEDFDSLPALARTALWELNAVIRFVVDVFHALDPDYRAKLADLDWHVFDFVTSKWAAIPAGSQTLLTLAFIARMERELHDNQRKGDWREWRPTIEEARSELVHHMEKLVLALALDESDERSLHISEYTADMANIVMKIFDTFGYKRQAPAVLEMPPASFDAPRKCSEQEALLLQQGYCPICKTSTLLSGPEGAECQNVKCKTCESEWNVCPMVASCALLVPPKTKP